MNKKLSFFLIMVTTLILAGCSKQSSSKLDAELSYDSSKTDYIQAISPSYINRLSEVSISFTKDIVCNESQLKDAIYFSPKQAGNFKLINSNTITFTPEKALKGNSKFYLNADVNKLLGAKEASPVYKHPFVVKGPTFDVSFDDLVLNESGDSYSLNGKVKTDIPISKEIIAKCIAAKIGKSKIRILINAGNASQKLANWDFSIPEIKIQKKPSRLNVKYKGKKLGQNSFERKNSSGIKNFTIPAATSDFSVININTNTKDSISLSFSKFLDSTQDIIESIGLFDSNDKRIYTKITPKIKNNVLTVYSDENFADVSTIVFASDIKSSDGKLLAQSTSVKLSNNWDIPEVRFMTSGNILPTSQGTVIPVETKNLTGLLIQAFVVYNHNINQFFQTNNYNGTNEMYRVGEPVWEKTVTFDWSNEMQNKFIPRGIDISELVKKYPGGMIQIRISFRKNNIMYACNNKHADFSKLPMPAATIDVKSESRESSYWDWDELNYEQRRSYWNYNKDPCHPAFYTESFRSNSVINRNIFVSDIGLMAKMTADKKLFINTSDIKTTAPMENVSISVYNFVGHKIAESKTNKSGRVIFENVENAFLVMANYENQYSYLKIDSATSLSTSHFETGGVISENGIKGFIYGERGVWRPGDDIHLTFVLQDLNKSLPDGIPVIFTLTDPLNRETEKRTLTKSVNGFYPIATKTSVDSMSGLWNANIKIGGKEWNKSIRVETVIPNKLAVKLSLDEDSLSSNTNTFTLSGSWLHGAEIPYYEADVTVSFTSGATTFDGYSEYTFENPNGFIDSTKETIFKGKVNENSRVTFTKKLNTGGNIPGKLKAHFISRIFEPSGVPSTESTVFDYSPFKRYVGLKLPKGDAARDMLLTDVEHTAEVALVSEKGEAITSANLEYSIYQMDWKWWWEKDAYTSATYIGSSSYTRVANGKVSIVNGKGSFNFMIKYPSWGRYLIQVKDPDSGHITGKVVYIDWPGWAGRSTDKGSGSSTMLPLAVDKKQYSVGETAKITFASSEGQRALATIEKGGNIFGQKWIETTKDTTTFELPLKSSMSPNVYVHITILQPHMQTMNSLPIRLYGVVPVMVDNPKTLLKPQITCDQTFEPSKKTSVSISEKNGKPMTYTIAVVDEGLLGLTAYHAPNIREEFYKKEASLLENWDIYKYVMNAYSGKLETLLAVGGSEEIRDHSDKTNNRFAPVVKYFGPYNLEAGEKKVTSFEMPNYIGAVRVMVVAGNKGAYGVAEKTVPVKSDFMVLPSMPRTLGTNEEIKIPVSVFNGTKSTKKVAVSVSAKKGIKVSKTRNVEISGNDYEVVYFNVSTANVKEGKTNFTFTVTDGKISQKSTVPILIESRGIPVTNTSSFTVNGDENQTVTVKSPGEQSTTKVNLEITTLPLINLNNRLEYLTSYPHGCIEQITSGAFPQLYIKDFVKLSDKQAEKTIRNINSVIERYPQYQNPNGSFSYWPNGSEAHLWGSTYAAHFLTEAKRLGYKVPSSMYNSLINWLATSAQDYAIFNQSDIESLENQVYRLFVLALAGHADIGAMNRIKDRLNSDSQQILMACAYALCGRNDTASALASNALITSSYSKKLDGVFSSSLRNQSIALLCYNYLKDNSQATKYAKVICDELNADKTLNTQETAWALFTLLQYFSKDESKTYSYTVNVNDTAITNDLVTKSDIISLPASDNLNQTVKITNNSKQPLFGTLSASGKSTPGNETEKSNGLKLTVNYIDSDGNNRNPSKLKKGDTFKLKVELKNISDSNLSNIALTIPVPTTWEFINNRLTQTKNTRSNNRDWDDYDDDDDYYYSYREDTSSNKGPEFTYQDIRDDNIFTYLNLNRNQSQVFVFDVTIVYDGNYFIPAIHAESMYDETLAAIVPGVYVFE